MARAFNRNNATLTAATAVRLSDLLAAEGYTGSMIGSFLEIDTQSVSDLLMADSATDIDTQGRSVALFNRTAPPAVDPSRIWLYSATGGEIGITFEPF